jgi:hypothetical protein
VRAKRQGVAAAVGRGGVGVNIFFEILLVNVMLPISLILLGTWLTMGIVDLLQMAGGVCK